MIFKKEGKEINSDGNVVKAVKVKMPINKDSIVIGSIIGAVILLTIAIVSYFLVFEGKDKVATYDDGFVTRSEYETYYRTFAPWLSYYGYDMEQVGSYIAEKIILDKVIYSEAIAEGFVLTEESKQEVDAMFTEEEITSLSSQGIDPEALKEIYYNDAVISEYIENLSNKVTTEEMRAYLKQTEGESVDLNVYETSHILFAFTETMTDADKADLLIKANQILAKAISGEDFATLAQENSDDSSSTTGGEVSVENPEYVYTEYIEAVRKLTVGQIYPTIVTTDAGYHIIKLNNIEIEGRLVADSQIDLYIDTKLSEMQQNSNYEIDTVKVDAIALKIGTELGLIEEAVAE